MFQIQLHKILDVGVCWDVLRQVRWSMAVVCPHCHSNCVNKNGKDVVEKHCQHYHYKSCQKLNKLLFPISCLWGLQTQIISYKSTSGLGTKFLLFY